MKISGVKVHSEHDAEMGAGPDFGNVHYSASIDGKRHKFYTEALHNDVIDHMHHAEATGEVHPDLKRHIMHQYKDGEGEPVKKSTFGYPGQRRPRIRRPTPGSTTTTPSTGRSRSARTCQRRTSPAERASR